MAVRSKRVERRTVDLGQYPDLVVISLGMRVNAITGLKRLFGLGPQIRQSWRDFAPLEAWTRSEPHQRWWQQFLRDSGGTGFGHETYAMRGGIEGIYDDMAQPTGLLRFAPVKQARGGMFSARCRIGLAGEPPTGAPLSEADLYSAEDAPVS
jgi:hypothetical protein